MLGCGIMPKLGASEGMLPRIVLKFTISEIATSGFRDHIHK